MIVCAAIKTNLYGQKIIIHGVRHRDCYFQALWMGIHANDENCIDGFVDNNGDFHDRFEALEIARNCGQISPTCWDYKQEHGENELYTEDLY